MKNCLTQFLERIKLKTKIESCPEFAFFHCDVVGFKILFLSTYAVFIQPSMRILTLLYLKYKKEKKTDVHVGLTHHPSAIYYIPQILVIGE